MAAMVMVSRAMGTQTARAVHVLASHHAGGHGSGLPAHGVP
jgi:hypothetical protein